MNTHITEFLEHVRPFLVAADEQDVLREIAGSIEDKATGMLGGATDENIIAAIAAMGDPRDVAAAWSTAKPAVAANYRKVHWLLAGLLYAVTVGLAIISAITGGSTFVAPVFYVPSLTPLSLLYYLPFALVFDYGLASILIQVNEHFGNRVGVEWARRITRRHRKRGRPTVGKVVGALMSVAGMLVLYLFARFGMPYVLNLQGPAHFMAVPFFASFAICLLAQSGAVFVVTCLQYVRDWPGYAFVRPLASMIALLVATTVIRRPVQSGLAEGALRGLLVLIVLLETWDLFKGVAEAFFAWNAAPES